MLSIIQQKDCWALLVPLTFGLPTGRVTNHRFSIGRELGNDLVIPELYISRRHATIFRKTQRKTPQFTIICHGKNRIFINQTMVTDSKPKTIRDEDQIWLSRGKTVPRERPIGYVFKTQPIKLDLIQMAKYQRQLNILQSLVGKVKQVLSCSKCHRVMITPIDSHPCGHKLCQKCTKDKIAKNDRFCNVCKRQISSFFCDPHLAKLTEAYYQYRFGSAWTREVKQDAQFCEEPYLLNSEGPGESVKSADLVSEGQKTGNQPLKVKKNKRVRWKDKINEQTSIPLEIAGAKNTKKTRANHEHNPPTALVAKDNQGQDSAVDTASQVNLDERNIKIPSFSAQEEDDCFRIEEPNVSAAQINLENPPEQAYCYNCNKKFLFANRNMNLKHCAVCLCPFCNIEYPPCSNGQQPLRAVDYRIKALNASSLLLLIEERFKVNVKKIILKNFQSREYCWIFLYVLMKGGGIFQYKKEKGLDGVALLRHDSCLCNCCWPGVASAMVIQFMKYHRQVIKTFGRRDVDAAIRDCQLYLDNPIKEIASDRKISTLPQYQKIKQYQQFAESEYFASREDVYREFEL